MRCPISFIPLDELEHPVVFRNQKALVVYDAEHLINWLKTKRRNPVTNELFKPITPLVSFLQPHRLPHTTDAQLARTHQLLVVSDSPALFRYALALRGLVYPVLDTVATPLIMCLSALLTVAVVTIVSEVALHALELHPGGWLFRLLEESVRSHNRVIVAMNFIYARFFHPCVAVVVRLYFGSDIVVRCWCSVLVAIDASPLLVQHNVTGVTGLDMLLVVCR